MKTQSRFLLVLFLICSFGITSLYAQISLAPTILYIHENRSIGQIYVTNTAQTAQEVTFGNKFSYPKQTEDGTVEMVEDDSVRASQFSLDGHSRIFPARMVLQPGQSQVVRIQVLPTDKPDGVYWSRFIASASALTPEVGATQVNGVGTQINFIVEQNIPLFYRKGENTTGVNVVDFKTNIVENGLEILPRVVRTGNSPFLGTIKAELYDGEGVLISELSSSAFFYFDDWTKITIPVDPEIELKGNFRVSLKFITQRNSISTADIVTADLIVHNEEISLD